MSEIANRAPLAWTSDGDPFATHPDCDGWRVYKKTSRGRNEVVHGENGPLHIGLGCDITMLRETCGAGSYLLKQVDEKGQKVAGATDAHIVVKERTQPNAEVSPATGLDKTLALVRELVQSQDNTIQHLRTLVADVVNSTAQVQLATAELVRSGTDAVTVASGAGLPEHFEHLATLLGSTPKEQKSNVEALLNSPVVGSVLMGMAQALKPKEAPAAKPAKPGDSQ